MRVYLDNCCFNRPFDEHVSPVIRLETDAKLHVQELIRSGGLELCWSFILDYENVANPFEEVRDRISEWKSLAVADCLLTTDKKILNKPISGISVLTPIYFLRMYADAKE